MNKLYYSDGREVRGGDTVRDLDYDPEEKYAEEYFYISEYDGIYSIHAPMGCLGDIDSVEGYELVERHEESKLNEALYVLKRLLGQHDQENEFGFYLNSIIRNLEDLKPLIK
jgi:hypothetical protein